ncbi:MAG: DEAD/DEAH box helicase family protein [Chloroflexi bacterium]|nr:DEAD/DEAH box helicase family protein [Chloroflexota bacterium]
MENQNPSLRIGLLDNSYHSLKRGYEIWSLWKKTDDAWLLKESIIWIHHGIELSLKQLLAQTNAFLVFENVDLAIENLGKLRKKEGMENADVMDLFDNSDRVKSVGFQSLIERVAVALSIPELAKNAPLRQRIDELTKYRNKIIHFSIELDIAAVSSLLSEILDPLLLMLEREVKDDKFIQNRIPEIRELAQPVKKFSDQFRQEIIADAIKATENAFASTEHRGAGIVWQTLGTGLGKTLLDYLVQVRKLSKVIDNHIVIVSDRVELATQIYNLLSSALFEDEIAYQVNFPRSEYELTEALESQSPKIIVSTIQRLTKYSFESNKEILLVGYDWHGFSNLLPDMFPNAIYILFTTVPPKPDSLSWLFFGDLIGKYDLSQAITDGVALPIKIEYRKIIASTDSVTLVQDEINDELAISFGTRLFTPDYITKLSEDIVHHFTAHQKTFRGKGIVLVPNIATGAAFSEVIARIQHHEEFTEATAISSMTHPAYREELIEKFKNQDDPFCLLIATGSFPLHFNNPLIHVVYVTSQISLQLRHQLAGLISRPQRDKKEAVIVDYVGHDWSRDVLY